MAKPLTPSEQLVGRRLPKEASYGDLILSSFLKQDMTFGGRAEPSDSWLRPAWSKIRKAGYVTRGMTLSFGGSRKNSFGIYTLTPRGETAALEAFTRVEASRTARRQWVQEFHDARKAAVASREGQNEPMLGSDNSGPETSITLSP